MAKVVDMFEELPPRRRPRSYIEMKRAMTARIHNGRLWIIIPGLKTRPPSFPLGTRVMKPADDHDLLVNNERFLLLHIAREEAGMFEYNKTMPRWLLYNGKLEKYGAYPVEYHPDEYYTEFEAAIVYTLEENSRGSIL